MPSRTLTGSMTLALLCALAIPAWAQSPGYTAPTPRKPTADEILARFAHEPSAQEVQEAALKFFRVDPEKVESLRQGARYKALMPRLETAFIQQSYEWNRDEDNISVDNQRRRLGFFFVEDEVQNYNEMEFQVRATWNLDRLVFNPEVLDVVSLVGIQDGVLKEVTTLYYARRRLQVSQALNPPKNEAAKISLQLRLQELTAIVDAMTGGFLSRRIAQGKRDTGAAVVPRP